MPLPLFIGAIAAIAAIGGVGAGAHGAVKAKKANDTLKEAKERHKRNVQRFETDNRNTTRAMDSLGKLELEILESFKEFSETIERIQNKPEFDQVALSKVNLPNYTPEELRTASVGAGLLLGGLGGAATGTAAGFAAAGGTTAAVMALGTASTGTAIATLSGAAATNATLAALGGGAIAAGGGGMALGTLVLGGATAGVGILVGGIIFNITGSKLADKANEAWTQMLQVETAIDKICKYLKELKQTAEEYEATLLKAQVYYNRSFATTSYTVNTLGKNDWNLFNQHEKAALKNSVLLVGLLYHMCKVSLVKMEKDKPNKINRKGITTEVAQANQMFQELDNINTVNTDKKQPQHLEYDELKLEIAFYSKNPVLCIRERSRLREIAHYYLLRRAEEVMSLPIDQQAEKTKKIEGELTRIIRTQKAGQNIRSAIQEAIARMGNNDRFHLLECDQEISWRT